MYEVRRTNDGNWNEVCEWNSNFQTPKMLLHSKLKAYEGLEMLNALITSFKNQLHMRSS